MRLVGTTKSTIAGIRDRTHWNAASLSPLDPVTLGLCSQIDLDFEVQRASKEKPAPADSGVDAAAGRRHHRAAGAGRAGDPGRGQGQGRPRHRRGVRQAQAARRQVRGQGRGLRLRPPVHPEHRAAGHRIDVVAGHDEAVLLVERDGARVVLVDEQVEPRRRDALAGVEQQRRRRCCPRIPAPPRSGRDSRSSDRPSRSLRARRPFRRRGSWPAAQARCASARATSRRARRNRCPDRRPARTAATARSPRLRRRRRRGGP